MLASVELNDEPWVKAGEVGDVGADRGLAAEAWAELRVAQGGPEQPFGVGHVFA
jgi:hypothetical protein